jgi:hypothetical protein
VQAGFFCAAAASSLVAVALKAGIAPWGFPAATLFAIVAAFGFAGALS